MGRVIAVAGVRWRRPITLGSSFPKAAAPRLPTNLLSGT